jgi:Tat protein translocase TatB subunit
LYLFILESIGTQELILIGMVALIVFGPRKLPQLAKTIGKTMADFRKVTNEFKSTWEKEVEEDKQLLKTFAEDPLTEVKPVKSVTEVETETKLLSPEVKELSAEEVAKLFPVKEKKKDETIIEESQPETVALSKRDWL